MYLMVTNVSNYHYWKCQNLFGRDWMLQIQLNWKQIYTLSSDTTLEQLLNHHNSLFESGLGILKDYKAKIYIDPQAKPKFCKACPVPYSMQAKVEEELDRLQAEGIIEPVQYAEWVALGGTNCASP